MMRNPVNFDKDIPNSKKKKELIFYSCGLKIYGVIPYILNRKLKAEFVSSALQMKENNFTIIGYQQKVENVQVLVNWLYKDAGFIWAMSQEKLYKQVDDDLPETIEPKNNFQDAIFQAFGVVVEVPDSDVPKPWDAVLGEMGRRPRPGDVVLGGVEKRRQLMIESTFESEDP